VCGWAIEPEFLPPGLARRLARRGLSLGRRGLLRPAAIGRGATLARRPEIRGDRVAWIDPPHATRAEADLLARLERLRRAINAELQLGAFDLELHWALYPPGARYARHLDRSRGTRVRVVSLVLYLNEGWKPADGGSLRLHLAAGATQDVLPEAGTLVAFASDRFEHEVLPARRERLSVTGWLRRRP
jgi:SM-20-related protein